MKFDTDDEKKDYFAKHSLPLKLQSHRFWIERGLRGMQTEAEHFPLTFTQNLPNKYFSQLAARLFTWLLSLSGARKIDENGTRKNSICLIVVF